MGDPVGEPSDAAVGGKQDPAHLGSLFAKRLVQAGPALTHEFPGHNDDITGSLACRNEAEDFFRLTDRTAGRHAMTAAQQVFQNGDAPVVVNLDKQDIHRLTLTK